MSAQPIDCNADGHRIHARKLLRRHADASETIGVLLDVGRDLVSRRRGRVDLRDTGQHHNVASHAVTVQIQRNARVVGDMRQLARGRSAVDE